MAERGTSIETALTFDVGFYAGPGLHHRLVIPIHNVAGELIAYCGRSVDQTQPRYRVPPGFDKSEGAVQFRQLIGLEANRQFDETAQGSAVASFPAMLLAALCPAISPSSFRTTWRNLPTALRFIEYGSHQSDDRRNAGLMHFHAVEKAFHNNDGRFLTSGCPMQMREIRKILAPEIERRLALR